jgi:hypothetical protein
VAVHAPTVLRSLLRTPDLLLADPSTFLTETPKGPQKLALILSQEAEQLLAMDLMNVWPCYGENLRSVPLIRRVARIP